MQAERPDSTANLEVLEATTFSDWTRIIGHRFVPLRVTTPADPAGFHGVMRTLQIDGIHTSDVVADPHRVERRAHDITTSDPRHLKLTLQVAGSGVVAQDGRVAELGPGDVAVYDTCRPYTLTYREPSRVLVMVFPHGALGLSAGLVHRVTAVRLAGEEGLGRVISPFMQHVADNLDQLTGGNGTRIVRSALDLMTALLSEELTTAHEGTDTAKRLLDAVRHYIDTHLADPDLSAEKVAREHFVSLRQLQYLFQEEGDTVSGYIRRRRLERCRLDLCDPALRDLSILRVAQNWGFTDPSHFSKAFRAAYATSPRSYRAQHLEARRTAGV